MKKLLLLLLSTGLVFASCSKWEDGAGAPQEQEVSFRGIETSINNLKSTCDNPEAQYAIVKIVDATLPNDTVTFTPEVFYLGGTAYTQSIKLNVGTYRVTAFQLMNDNETPGFDFDNGDDDILVLAAPNSSSTYGSYSSTSLPITTQVSEFEKNEIPIEVLCFEETNYDKFGFRWFRIDQVNVREQVFFGDLCVKDPEGYLGSAYANQANGVQVDMPAIFRIDVYSNDEFVQSFEMNEWNGAPLKVTYVDKPFEVDHFKFELFILVQDGPTFSYKFFHSWEFDDAERIPAGDDNVVDFVLGNCMVDDADLVLAPYINLPATATYQYIHVGENGSQTGGYFDAVITNVGDASTKYELYDGLWPSWCADKLNTLDGSEHNMDVYSSLYPDQMPPFILQGGQTYDGLWPQINWLMNHLNYYPEATVTDIQEAIWLILGWSIGNADAIEMANDAAIYGINYVPLPGGWGAVIFIEAGTPPDATQPPLQTVFIRVDP